MAFRAEPSSMLDLHCNLYDWTQVAVVGKPKGGNENSSTNAVIAAACTTEVFKVVTSCCNPLSNYMNFNDSGACVFYLRVKISCRFKFQMEFTPMSMSKKGTLTALFVVEDHRN